jgi:hypothetical protein
LLHSLAKTDVSFDDPNLVSHAGLVPVMALAQRAGLGDLAAEHVRPGGKCGVNAAVKVPCLVAGMAAGADSIDDMDLLRHGAMEVLFGGIRAPSTLGSHLRCYPPGFSFIGGLWPGNPPHSADLRFHRSSCVVRVPGPSPAGCGIPGGRPASSRVQKAKSALILGDYGLPHQRSRQELERSSPCMICRGTTG